jgi:hypothetical protein
MRDTETLKLPNGWEMITPGYLVDKGQTKAEKKSPSYVRWCDARWGTLRIHSDDKAGVPNEVVAICLISAKKYPAFRAKQLRSIYPGKLIIPEINKDDEDWRPNCLGQI